MVAAAADRFGGPARLLPWMEAVSVRHAKDLVVFGLTRLQRVCLWEQCIGDFHRKWSTLRLFPKVQRLFGWFVPQGFP
jgi:hypothetical protein